MTVRFPVTIQNDSYGARITAVVALLTSTITAQSAIPCTGPDCTPPSCDLFTAIIEDFRFNPNSVGFGSSGVFLHMEVRYWAGNSGGINLNMWKGTATCASFAPQSDMHPESFSPTGTEPGYKGRLVKWDWLVQVSNNCDAPSEQVYYGSVTCASQPCFKPSIVESRATLTLQGLTPRLDQISPERGLIGSTINVTISGARFGSNPTVNVGGSGIAVTITSRTDTQIAANFAIATTAGAGAHAVTVTANGQTSNSINFFVQVPTSRNLRRGCSRFEG